MSDPTSQAAGTRPARVAIDVSALPTVTFGARSLMSWGTAGFMVIEGWTLALAMMTYLYVRQNFESWPPPRTPRPDLLIPTINVLLMLASLLPAWWTRKRALALDKRGVLRGLALMGALGVVILALRWFELWALNVRWDSNAYGSVAWLVVGLHTTLLLIDVGDTIGLAILFATKAMPPHYFSDVEDNSLYWWFMVVGSAVVYLLVYVGPHVL